MPSPPPPTLTHATAAGLIAISDLVIEDRIRTDSFEIRTKIAEHLAPSIAEFGLIHPITVERLPDGRLKLIAGWCRTQAFLLLKQTHISYCFVENLKDGDAEAMEIEENIRRHSMSWQDECLGIRKVHLVYTRKAHLRSKRWGKAQTGHLLNYSAAYMSDCLVIAELLEKGDKEILSAPHYSAAQKVLSKRAEDKIAAELIKRNNSITTVARKISRASGPISTSSPNDTPSLLSLLDLLSPSLSKPLKKNEGPHEIHEVALSKILFHTKNELWFDQRADESIDLIYTDIPYGIDMEDLDIADLERVEEEHDVEENVEQMPVFLRNAYRVLKNDSFLLFWMDLKHWEKLTKWGQDVGFVVQEYPLVWIKTHECKNRAAHCKWTKAIEYVMVMRKGKPALKTPQLTNYLACSGKAERKLQMNPFAKPFEFTKWLLEPVMLPGMTVLDCYAGEGSLVRALLNLGANVIALEKKANHFNRLTEHVKQHFKNTLQGEIHFV